MDNALHCHRVSAVRIVGRSHNLSFYARLGIERSMKIEQRISERHGLSQSEGHSNHDWHHCVDSPHFNDRGDHERYANPSTTVP